MTCFQVVKSQVMNKCIDFLFVWFSADNFTSKTSDENVGDDHEEEDVDDNKTDHEDNEDDDNPDLALWNDNSTSVLVKHKCM